MSFGVNVAKVAHDMGVSLEQARRALIIKLFSAVIEDTPVLTGRLRGNWISSVGSPVTEPLQDVDNETAIDFVVSNGAKATAAKIKRARRTLGKERAIASVVAAANAVKGDETVYFRNNLPYAYRVEFEGWSHTKAPKGMLRKNLARIRGLLQKRYGKGE